MKRMPTLYGKKVYVSAHTEAKMEIHIALAQQIGFIRNRKEIEEIHFAHCTQFYRNGLMQSPLQKLGRLVIAWFKQTSSHSTSHGSHHSLILLCK